MKKTTKFILLNSMAASSILPLIAASCNQKQTATTPSDPVTPPTDTNPVNPGNGGGITGGVQNDLVKYQEELDKAVESMDAIETVDKSSVFASSFEAQNGFDFISIDKSKYSISVKEIDGNQLTGELTLKVFIKFITPEAKLHGLASKEKIFKITGFKKFEPTALNEADKFASEVSFEIVPENREEFLAKVKANWDFYYEYSKRVIVANKTSSAYPNWKDASSYVTLAKLVTTNTDQNYQICNPTESETTSSSGKVKPNPLLKITLDKNDIASLEFKGAIYGAKQSHTYSTNKFNKVIGKLSLSQDEKDVKTNEANVSFDYPNKNKTAIGQIDIANIMVNAPVGYNVDYSAKINSSTLSIDIEWKLQKTGTNVQSTKFLKTSISGFQANPTPNTGTGSGTDNESKPAPAPTPTPSTGIKYNAANTYYEPLNGKSGDELLNALIQLQTQYTEAKGRVSNYGSFLTKDKYNAIFIDKWFENDGTLLDIYSENPDGADPYTYPDYVGGSSAKAEGQGTNREHVIPKSWFNNDTLMHHDLHLVWPTDIYVNGKRSNYAYGEVERATWTSKNGSKLGSWKDNTSITVFEPIDAFKGDVARVYLYAAITYTQISKTSGSGSVTFQNAFPYITPKQLDMFIRWHELDPVDGFDIFRNEKSSTYEQGLRNPFIDYPELVQIFKNKDSVSFTNKGVATI